MATKTSLEKIHAYLNSKSGNVTLSAHDRQIMERARAAWDLRLKLFSKMEVVNRLMSNFKISQKTAFNDIDFSERLYSNPTINHKKAQRAILSNTALRRIRLAEQNGDDKTMQKWFDLLGKYNLLDKEDPVLPDADKLKIADLITGIDPRLEKALITLIDKTGPTDITKLYDAAQKIEIEEAEFEELPINEA